jgi:glycosyltransferase involved in cell wall biosynthesis
MISVVIVTYNADRTLQDCLNSIYQQRSQSIDIIVIDGSSTDKSKQILEENNDRISFWLSEKDEGIYDAMNKALRYVKTPWVIFLGADDTLMPDFSDMLTELKDSSIVYYSNVIYKNEKHSGFISSYSQAKSGIFHQSIIYPAAVFEKHRYDNRYKVAADYALNMHLYGDDHFSFQYLDYTVAKYNDTGISSIVVDKAFEQDKSKLILKNFGIKIWFRYLFRRFKKKFISNKKVYDKRII